MKTFPDAPKKRSRLQNVTAHFEERLPNNVLCEGTDESLLYLSVLTLGEIRRGIAVLPQSRRRASLEAWLDKDLRARFEDRILEIDQEVADRWGLLTATARNSGIVLPVIDGLLAATALEHNLTLVTRDTGQIPSMGVAVFNPWQQN